MNAIAIASPASSASAMMPSVSIDDLLAERERVFEVVRGAIRTLLASPHHSAVLTHLDSSVTEQHREHFITEMMERYRKSYDCSAWQSLMKRSGLWSFLDAEAREKWNKDLSEREGVVPIFARAAVEDTFKRFYAERGLMVERGVIHLFRRLSWHYKSNSPVCLGRKLVVTNVVDWHSRTASYYARCSGYSNGNQLDDLLRTLCVLDGKPEPDWRNSVCAWLSQTGFSEAPWIAYFDLKRFKNGNVHVRFKRDDLVLRLNSIIAKHYPGALPNGQRRRGP